MHETKQGIEGNTAELKLRLWEKKVGVDHGSQRGDGSVKQIYRSSGSVNLSRRAFKDVEFGNTEHLLKQARRRRQRR